MSNDNQANFDFDALGASPSEPDERSLDHEGTSDPDWTFVRSEQSSLDALSALIDRCVTLSNDYRRHHGSHAFATIGFNREHLYESAVKDSIDRLIQRARTTFGFAGREAPIDSSEIYSRFLPSQRRRMCRDTAPEAYAFTPAATWEYLKNTYRSTGRILAMQATANVLLDRLPIGRNSSDRIRQAGAFMIFDLHFRAEPRSSLTRGHGQYALSIYEQSHDRLPMLADALVTFMAWATTSEGVPSDVAADVKAMKEFVFSWSGFDLRHKMQIGPVSFTFFKNKCEMKMPMALVEKLNLFLTEFAGERLRDRMS